MNIEKINNLIDQLETIKERNKIFDGYHSFGELYDHRVMLYILVCKLLQKEGYSIWKSKIHHDGSFIEGMFVLGVGNKNGSQISYHLEIDSYWDITDFAIEPEPRDVPIYDLHTSADVLERLQRIIDIIIEYE